MHAPFDRRRFLLALGAATVAGTLPLLARAAMGPNDKFDLVIKGGEVLDPSQNLGGVRDIGIRNGVVEAVQADIPAERALKVLSASGRLVTPGLIDLHAHTFPYGSAIGIPADELVPFQGTTTAVSAGDAGANNFAAYRRFIVASTRTRLYAFVHIANIGQNGKLLPAAIEAKKRGVHFDIGHGGGSFDYTVAEAAIAQGVLPDTISSDMHVFSGNTPGMPFLTWVMSKFLNMGFTLEQVVAMATINSARAIDRLPKLGTLQVGAPGDATLLEVVEGPVEFVDTRNNKRTGKAFIRPVQTVAAGIAFGRPYSAPFSAH